MLDEDAEYEYDRAVDVARRIYADTGFPPALDDTRLDVGSFMWPYSEEMATSFPPHGLSVLPDHFDFHDAAHRSVYAAALYWVMTEGRRDSSTEPAPADMRAFRNNLDSIEPAAIPDAKLLRWELTAATVADHTERVLALGRRIEEIAPTAQHLALVARSAFRCIHPARSGPSPSTLDPEIHGGTESSYDIDDLVLYSLALIVEPLPRVPWRYRTDVDTDTRHACAWIQSLIDRVVLADDKLPETLAAIKCWCRQAVAFSGQDFPELRRAGEEYVNLPLHPLAIGTEQRDRGHKSAAAARCFIHGKDFASAVDVAKQWTQVAPLESRAWHLLAEALYKDGRTPDAFSAFEEALRTRRDDSDDWQASLFLQIGLEGQDRSRMAAAVQTAALEATFRPQLENLIQWLSPWFDSLPRQARERWWIGLYMLISPDLANDWRDTRFDFAAAAFGEAVAFALKAGVFAPYRQANRSSSPDDNWRRVLDGRGTLGQMIQCLLQTRYPIAQAARQLADWLDANRPAIRPYVTRKSKDLERLIDLRNRAQHDTVGQADARTVYETAADVLTLLVRANADGPPAP